MFKNNLAPPPPKKVPHKCSNHVQTMISMIADDATMNVISWNYDFPSQNPF